MLIASLPNRWETLVVSLGVSIPHGKQLTLDVLKSSFLNEEARGKDKETTLDQKTLITEEDPKRGRGR